MIPALRQGATGGEQLVGSVASDVYMRDEEFVHGRRSFAKSGQYYNVIEISLPV